MTAEIMGWVLFILGVGLLIYFSVTKLKGASIGETITLLTVPTFLILVALFAPRINIVKFGKDGFEFDLNTAKAAAAKVVEENPKVAESLSSKKGPAAITEAVQKIENAKSLSELNAVIPVDIKNDAFVFHPKISDRETMAVQVKGQQPKNFSIEYLKKE